MRARADVSEITADLVAALQDIRQYIPPEGDDSLAHIETFCAVALRVLRKTNPSKIRDAAMAEEIKARIDGREVIE
jgi:hypothetical protein